MARTFSGLLFYDASQINFTGTATYTRQAKGDVSVNQGASLTVQYQMGTADVKRPFVTFTQPGITSNTMNELKEAFGNAAGGPGDPFGPGFGPTVTKPWGLAVIDIFAVYSVAGAALQAGSTLGVTRQAYSNNAAFTITDVIAPTAVTLPTSTSISTPYVFKLSAAQPLVYESVDNTDLSVELILVTTVAGSARVYGLGMHVAVEYS